MNEQETDTTPNPEVPIPVPMPSLTPPPFVPPAGAPVPSSPQYQQPTSGSNGLGIASMVIGIVAFLLGWFIFLGLFLGAAAVVLGIIGIKKHSGKGMAIAGLVTGGVAALWNLVIIAIFITGLALFGGTAAQLSKTASDLTTQQQSQITAKKDFAKGDTAQFDAFSVKVNSVTRNYVSPDQYSKPADGKEFVVVNLSATNTSSDSTSLSPYDFTLNVGGVAVDSTYVTVAPDFTGGTVSKGATVTGNIVYEITKDATNLKLQYEEPFYSSSDPSVTKLTYTLAI